MNFEFENYAEHDFEESSPDQNEEFAAYYEKEKELEELGKLRL